MVEGVVERITFESAESGFRVIKVAVPGRAERLSVVGAFPPTTLGARVRVRGRIEVDRKHGEQLRADSFIEIAPDTLAGLERYLSSGIIKGVGPKLAQRIVAAFGLETLKVLDEEPERLRAVEGIGEKRRAGLVKAWREQRATRDVMVFLQSHGASPALAMRIVRAYGATSMSTVSRAPYRLALDIRGVGFKTADRIALSVGVAPDSPERMQAGVLQAIHDATEAGHVWTSQGEVTSRTAQMLAVDEADRDIQARVTRAVDALVPRYAAIEEVSGERAIFASEMHAAEERLARRLAEIARASVRALGGVEEGIRAFEAGVRVELAPEQRSAVEEAARRPILVITGGPGVGKTTIVRAILAVLARSQIDVRLAAPTGRAAKRLSESTGMDATTRSLPRSSVTPAVRSTRPPSSSTRPPCSTFHSPTR
jgi:exodeoxyribonuclease V alpha subunit